MKLVFISVLFMLTSTSAFSQLAQWAFSNDETSATKTTNVTASRVTAVGVGSTAIRNISLNPFFRATDWPQSEIAEFTSYFEFSITPDANQLLMLSSLTFCEFNNASGPQSFSIKTSRDNFSSTIYSRIIPADNLVREHTVDLRKTAFQGVEFGITFRIYGYNSRMERGFWYIDDITINGSSSQQVSNSQFKDAVNENAIVSTSRMVSTTAKFSDFIADRDFPAKAAYPANVKIDPLREQIEDKKITSMLDDAPSGNQSYFRLNQVAIDSKRKYSRLVAVSDAKTTFSITVIPNSAATFVKVKTGRNSKLKNYRIFDRNGLLLHAGKVKRKGIPIQNLAVGEYQIQLTKKIHNHSAKNFTAN